jgi:hypothetical protein
MTEPAQLNLLSEIPPVYECEIGESAGVKDEEPRTQLTELPGDNFEDIFA